MMGSLMGSFGGGGGIAGLAGGAGFLGGAGNVIGGLASGGLAGGGAAISSAVGGASMAAGAGSFAMAAGAVAVPLVAAAAAFSFLSSKTKELDRGIMATVSGADTLVQQFDKVQKSRFWGLSKKVRSTLSDADDATTDAITNTVNSLQAGVRASAEALGISADAFDDFSYSLRISTKGMSGEAAQQAVQNALAGMADAMASMAPGMSAFNGAGNVDALIAAAARERDVTKAVLNARSSAGMAESGFLAISYRNRRNNQLRAADQKFANASAEIRRAAIAGNAELLSRFARSLLTVNASMETLGLTVRSVSLASGAATDWFAGLFGGLERFTEVSQSYYENFYTDAERVARATELLSAELNRLGINAIPATRAAFRALVEQADKFGDPTLVASLMQLAPAFIGVRDGIDALAAAAAGSGSAFDGAARAMEDLFATGQDFRRAMSRADNGITTTPLQSDAELRAEMRGLNSKMEVLVSAMEITANNTGRSANAADDQLAVTLEQNA
jgi:hypothetical protein